MNRSPYPLPPLVFGRYSQVRNCFGPWPKRRPGMIVVLMLSLFLVTGCSLLGGSPDSAKTTPAPQPVKPTHKRIAPPPGPAWPDPIPTQPPETTRTDEVGACAVAKHYLKLIPWSLSQGDSDLLQGLAASDCKACQKKIREINQEKAVGGWTRANPPEAVELDHQTAKGADFGCTFYVIWAPLQEWTPELSTIKQHPSRRRAIEVTVSHEFGVWKVKNVKTAFLDSLICCRSINCNDFEPRG